MAIADRLRRPTSAAVEVLDEPRRFGTLDGLIDAVNWLGQTYPLGLQTSMGRSDQEPIPANFAGYARGIYQANGPVFALIAVRAALFSEARFMFQTVRAGRPSELFGTDALRVLERPWPNGTTREMLIRAEQDVSLAGNSYLLRDGVRLRRLRPDRVVIILGSQREPEDPAVAWDADVVGFAYLGEAGQVTEVFPPEQVAHWSPTPDPLAHYRGMSWLTPVLREVQADSAATQHKEVHFTNAATPNLVVTVPKLDYESFKDFKEDFNAEYAGVWNAYKTLFLGGGADVKAVGSTFEQMEFKDTQGAGETRLAAAANVPPIIAGFSEGLASATYSNYGQARRRFGDLFARPQWGSFAAAHEKLVTVPSGARLWYDDRDIPALREDLGEEAKIRQTDAVTLRTLIDAGFDADAAIAFTQTSNMAALEGAHSGLFSVQLQPPGSSGGDGGEGGVGSDTSGTAEGQGDRGKDLEPVDGIDPMSIATLLQKVYLATPDKRVVTVEEARSLVREAGFDLPTEVPPDLMPGGGDDSTPGDVGEGDANEGEQDEPDT